MTHLRSSRPALAMVLALVVVSMLAPAARAQNYTIDSTHASVVFHIRHAGISEVFGMFAQTAGAFTLDADPAKTSFAANIQADSLTTLQAKRDEHLRGPDFFNVKQFPAITFKSTKVAATKEGYQVTGDLTLHGVTKPVTLNLAKGGETEFPKGTHRAGFSSELTIKRSEFGMTNFVGLVGDEVKLLISFEGIRQ